MMDSPSLPQPVGAPPAAHWKFWGTALWGILIALTFLALQALTVAGVLISRNPYLSEEEFIATYVSTAQDGYVVSVATLVTALLGCALVAGVVKLKKHSILGDYLALRPVPLKVLLRWFALLAALIILADIFTVLIRRPIVPDFMAEVYATANPVWLLWIALLVGAPLFEETFFRGFLFRGFASSFLGTAGTVLVTSGLWALMHVQYDAFGITLVFALGLLLGVARARTGSLVVPLLMHSAANLVATIETAVIT
jgi:membrane protease YdiL (CAAX protease family)